MTTYIRNILVTGVNGQLGKAIRKISKDFDYNFFFTDTESLDITDKNKLKKTVEEKKINIIINCAAYTAVDKAEEEQEKAYRVNAEAVENIANICKKKDILLIHISTDYVFDGKNYLPYQEDDAVNPINIYGKSKLQGEQVIRKIKPKSIIIRTSWVYSEDGHNFVKSMLKLAKTQNNLKVIYDQIGSPTYAGDLARVILYMIQFPIKNKVEIYHYSNEGVCSWYDLAKAIFEIKNVNIQVDPITTDMFPTQAKRPRYSLLSKDKIKKHYNIEIPYWRESLKKMLKKYNG